MWCDVLESFVFGGPGMGILSILVQLYDNFQHDIKYLVEIVTFHERYLGLPAS